MIATVQHHACTTASITTAHSDTLPAFLLRKGARLAGLLKRLDIDGASGTSATHFDLESFLPRNDAILLKRFEGVIKRQWRSNWRFNIRCQWQRQKDRCSKPAKCQRIQAISSCETLDTPAVAVTPSGPAAGLGALSQQQASIQPEPSNLPILPATGIAHPATP